MQEKTNSNNSRKEKPKTSESKLTSNVFATCKQTTNYSYYEEEEKIRKKNSLKEILKNKKSFIPYRPSEKGVSMSGGSVMIPVKKYFK